MIRTATLGLISLSCCSAAVAAPKIAPSRLARIEAGLLPPVAIAGETRRTLNLQERMAFHKVPAVSIALIENDRVVWSRAYGKLASGESLATTPETRFQGGSLSKPITAAAALMLAAEKRLALDVPINTYLTSWKVPHSEVGKPELVTLRRILSHSAGLTVPGFRGYQAGATLPTLRQVLDGAAPANSPPVMIDQIPGSAVQYSGGGYMVAQQAIEDVTGRPFGEVVSARLFRPLGMSQSTFAQPLTGRIASVAAAGHKSDGSVVPGRSLVLPQLAAAGLWTTPTDLGRFVAWLLNGSRKRGTPMQQAVAEQMLKAQAAASGQVFRTPAGNESGLGLVIEGTGTARRFLHSGSNSGYRAIMLGFPATGQGAVVMANSDTSPELMKEILRSLAAEYKWPERFHRVVTPAAVDPATMQGLAGTYRFASREGGGRAMELVVKAADGALTVSLPDGSKPRLLALSSTSFIDPESDRTFEFGTPGVVSIPSIGIVAKRD